MNKYAIVVVGYNRDKGIKRLLDSLKKAYYGDDSVDLIISIDYSGTNTVRMIAEEFEWIHGEKIIKAYAERQGLRRHILQCGDFLVDYDAIAVFEDDIVVSDGFYSYMKNAVERYYNDSKIAGISLYNHLWNVNVRMPFEAAPTPYDTYFLQFAQSWGQIWIKEKWFAFIEWYKRNSDEFGEIEGVPAFVCGWPKSSWLKYHIRYCIEKDLYFVYPYQSLCTCFSDVGEHSRVSDTTLQVPMLSGSKMNYAFPSLDDTDCAIYDAFFERRWLFGEIDGIHLADISVNLYGNKGNNEGKKYVLAFDSLPYHVVSSYGLDYKPHELNFMLRNNGKKIKLYNTTIHCAKEDHDFSKVEEFRYRFRLNGKTKMMAKCVDNAIRSKITRCFQKRQI